MKKICWFLLLLLACLPLRAQTPRLLEGPEREAAIAGILQANDLRSTLQFRFVMTRHSALLTDDLVSRGHAAFAFPDRLRWEVTSPRRSVFVMNGELALDRRQQSLLHNLTKLSEGGLINEKDFGVTVYAAPGCWQVDLVPLRRDLSQLFARITLLADAATGALRSVVLSETGGDTTQLEFSDVVRGAALDPQLFLEP